MGVYLESEIIINKIKKSEKLAIVNCARNGITQRTFSLVNPFARFHQSWNFVSHMKQAEASIGLNMVHAGHCFSVGSINVSAAPPTDASCLFSFVPWLPTPLSPTPYPATSFLTLDWSISPTRLTASF